MNNHPYLHYKDKENPLASPLPAGGGMCSVFRTIGCVGDSLASGEFEVVMPKEPNANDPALLAVQGQKVYLDMFEHSWGQHIARMAGCTARNFSRGGMTAKEYCQSFAEANDFWNPDKACQAYIVGLGVNDIINARQPVGSMADVKADWHENADSFAGWFGQLLARLRELQPHAPLFLLTMPRDEEWPRRKVSELVAAHAALMYDMAAHFGNAYVLDLYRFAPEHDAAYKKAYYMNGHLNAVGYRMAAEQIVTYIDWIIRRDPAAFGRAGLIGTPYYV